MREAANGKNLWVVGGGALAAAFRDHGLLDEIIVQIAPVTLGSGSPLFPRHADVPALVLESVTRMGESFVELKYRVCRDNTSSS
jgi:dihydrofolate reductase